MSNYKGLVSGLLLIAAPAPLLAEGRHFGLLAKSVDDANFVTAWHGCQEEARLSGDDCTLLGPQGASTPRLQMHALQRALEEGNYDALAISVTKSDIIARPLGGTSLPVVTFDSPFTGAEQAHSRGYIGTDNLAFGMDLGKLAQRLKPDGGSLCLMTAAHDPNLAQRVLGVRRQLSGDPALPAGRRLNGQKGWTESERCPWDTDDNPRRTRQELLFTLSSIRPDLLVSVGHWPLVRPDDYREMVTPFATALQARDTQVIVGVGEVTPAHQALLDEGLVHGLVSIDFHQIGRLAADYMRRALAGDTLPPWTFVPNKHYPADALKR